MSHTAAHHRFHIIAKPSGAICNLRCDYCYFLKKEQLYPGSSFRMSEEVLESYVRQLVEVNGGSEVTVAWQGGEPTLMGLDFFRRAVEYERKCRKPGATILNSLQTNGVLLDEEWCRFLRENRFLVGLSLDGPKVLHDTYRHDKAGHSVFDRVVQAARLMQEHKVDFNILCTINAANGDHPLDVYRFFRDEVRAEFIQFIPVVERRDGTGPHGGDAVTDRSVRPEQFGRFLIEIFDEWVRRDVGRTFVLTFDGLLEAWLYGQSSTCAFQPTCGGAPALEHNGDLYSCDHFVEPQYLSGNILETPLIDLVTSEAQQRFGLAKRDALPRYCLQCEFLFGCHGECPKNRISLTPEGEPGLNYLCPGYKAFFKHVEQPMRVMAGLLRRGRPADGIMTVLAAWESLSSTR